MSLDTTMVSIDPHFTIKVGKMHQCIALLKGNNLDLKSMIGKDGLIRTNIKKEAYYRINFCREETKKAIPKLVKNYRRVL